MPIAPHAQEGCGMDGGAGHGGNGKDEAAVPGGFGGPGSVVDVVPAEGAGDDTGDKSSLGSKLVGSATVRDWR